MGRFIDYPIIKAVELLDKDRRLARIFFSDGVVREVQLPKTLSSKPRIINDGGGLALGGGFDVSAMSLRTRRGKTLKRG